MDLGTWHAATRTWIPQAEGGSFLGLEAQDSIYDNTCSPGTGIVGLDFTDASELLVDTGQIPGPGNTAFPSGGNTALFSEEYRVNGFRWAICPSEPDAPAGQPGPLSATLFWWNCLDSCLNLGDAELVTPTASITIDGIPGGGSSNVCFVFDVDLTGMEFLLSGDCDGVFDGPGEGAPNDTFGYGVTVQRTDGMPMTGGVAIGLGGDPGTQTVGFGCRNADGTNGPAGFIGESTSFLNETRHVDGSTGFGNFDDFMDSIGGSIPGCFSLGYFVGLTTTPYVGLYHELYGDPILVTEFEDFCSGDGGDQMGCTDCPCMNDAPAGTVGGCLNGVGQSARLLGSGVASILNDSTEFRMTGGNPNTFGVLVSGDNALPNMGACPPGSGLASPLLDGLRCTGGAVQRHGARPTDGNGDVGFTTNPWANQPFFLLLAGFVGGQTRRFQVFYREDPANVCGRGQNTTQGVAVTFLP